MEIIHPTLLLDEDICRQNIERMCRKMSAAGVIFRPHFKTHQSLSIGRWFRDYGIDRMTASSVRMAEYFAGDGWKDITVAFPVNIMEVDRINALARLITLNLLAEDADVLISLDRMLTSPVNIFLKIDTGTHRTGIDPEALDILDQCVEAIQTSRHLTWKGFLAHAGHTYRVRNSVEKLRRIYILATDALALLKARYVAQHHDIIVSFGDTPGASLLQDFTGFDEMRPGNFVFYDMMQAEIGSCRPADIAVAMFCPVVSVHQSRHEFVIYGGGIHFSKDAIFSDHGPVYGVYVSRQGQKWDGTKSLGSLNALSQEHGVVRLHATTDVLVRPGDIVAILPVHSCLTAQCMGGYFTTSGSWIDHLGMGGIQ